MYRTEYDMAWWVPILCSFHLSWSGSSARQQTMVPAASLVCLPRIMYSYASISMVTMQVHISRCTQRHGAMSQWSERGMQRHCIYHIKSICKNKISKALSAAPRPQLMMLYGIAWPCVAHLIIHIVSESDSLIDILSSQGSTFVISQDSQLESHIWINTIVAVHAWFRRTIQSPRRRIRNHFRLIKRTVQRCVDTIPSLDFTADSIYKFAAWMK